MNRPIPPWGVLRISFTWFVLQYSHHYILSITVPLSCCALRGGIVIGGGVVAVVVVVVVVVVEVVEVVGDLWW